MLFIALSEYSAKCVGRKDERCKLLTPLTPLQQTPPKAPLRVYSIKGTLALEKMLQQLSQDASDNLGWAVSSSAVVRVLIRYARRQPQAWITSALYPLIEQEIAQGRVWGTKKT